MFYELAEKALALEKNGKQIIRLNIGDTGLPTPQCAIDAAVASIKNGKSGYGSSAGLPELREKIAEREGCETDEIVIGSGSKHIIYALISIIGRDSNNKNIVFPSPHWPMYGLACRQIGLNPIIVKTTMEKEWQFDALPLDNAAMTMICNPLNPTSNVYSEKSMQDMLAQAHAKNIPVIIDEAYKGLAFKPIPKYEHAIRVRSFSKEFNMEGWRLGYAIAPKDVAKKLVAFSQITSTCVPEFIQRAGMACLENENEILDRNRAIWHKRSEVAQKALRKTGFRFVQPDAGIYIFATHEKIDDANSYCLNLLEKGIAVASGSDFGGYTKFVRICLNQTWQTLERAIGLMQP